MHICVCRFCIRPIYKNKYNLHTYHAKKASDGLQCPLCGESQYTHDVCSRSPDPRPVSAFHADICVDRTRKRCENRKRNIIFAPY